MRNLNTTWFWTEKIDGTSTTFTMKQDKPKKRDLIVCSRNVVYNAPEKEDRNYYKDSDGNVYLEMAEKYCIETALHTMLNEHPEWEWITLQGETYGGGVQKRKYCDDHRLAIFNIIYKENGKAPVRLNPVEMERFLFAFNEKYDFNIPWVPVLGNYPLPDTCEELLALAGGLSFIDGGMREGIVFRSIDGRHSFKAVDNNFLLKYHG
jgi:hypothetical protein